MTSATSTRARSTASRSEGITLRVGRYGAYVERLPRDEQGQVIEGGDPQRASVSDDIAPDELTVELSQQLLEKAKDNARGLGTDPRSGTELVAKDGRMRAYITAVLPQDTEDQRPQSKRPKPRPASLLQAMDLPTVTLEDALKLLRLPRVVGTTEDGTEVTAQNGRYGPYLKKGSDSRSLETEEQLFTITMEEAEKLYAQRSEEHTSELQSRGHLVCRLPLENKTDLRTL